jgi:tRNA nucleotidyltransferase/poly(A) polymerase
MIDITGQGISDIKSGYIRTPMDPDETFNDDPVRILRGLRFANRFNWTIDTAVWEALLRHIHRLNIVSRERVHSEFCKMLNGPDPIAMLETLKSTGALEVMIPGVATLYNGSRDEWKAGLNRLTQLLQRYPEAPTRMRLACLFIGLAAKASDASKITRLIMQTLRFDRPIVSDVSYLVRFNAVTDEEIANWRFVRAMQNLAAVPRRMDFLLGFLAALNRAEIAAKLRNASMQLVQADKSGFTPDKESVSNRKSKSQVAQHRKRQRRRKHRQRQKSKSTTQ